MITSIQGEYFEPIPGYTNYLASNLGAIVSLKGTPKRLLPQSHSSGYLQVLLWKNRKPRLLTVHSIIARTFLGKCPAGKEINHRNGIKTDNSVDNLEYVTHAENIRHARKLRPWSKGSVLPLTILPQIEAARHSGVKWRVIAANLNRSAGVLQAFYGRNKISIVA